MPATARRLLMPLLLPLAVLCGRLWGWARLGLAKLRRATADRPELLLAQASTAKVEQRLRGARTEAAYMEAALQALESAAACPTCKGTGRVFRRTLTRDKRGRLLSTWEPERCACGSEVRG